MRRVASFLERSLLPLVVLAGAAGLLLPAPARAADAANGIIIVLVVLVAAVGLGLPVAALTDTRQHAGRITLVILVPLIGLPALAWAASRLLPSGPLHDGVLAAGVAPAEVASVALAGIAGGSAALASTILVGSTVGSVLLAGPTLHLLAGGGSSFSNGGLLMSLLEIVAVPLAAGIAARAAVTTARRHSADQLSSTVTSVAVLVLIWLVAGQAHLGRDYMRGAVALLVFLAGSTLLGAVLTIGLAKPDRTSLLLPVAMRDFAIAAGIATRAFGPPAASVLGLYGFFVLLLGAAATRTTNQ